MHSISITTILLIVVAVLCGDCEACDCPFRIVEEQNDYYKVIRCSDGETGVDVSNATFFRNGLDMETDDCLRDTFVSYNHTYSKLTLRPVSLCDGFYTCGKDSKLSKPVAIYSKPVQNGPGNGQDIKITLEEGANKTLPCHVSTSPINTQTTTWRKGPVFLDHSEDESNYHIVNAAKDVHDGSYWCAVKSSNFPVPVESSAIVVTVEKKFTPATFTGSLTYTIDDEDTAHFSSSAEYNENYKVNYQWYINDSVVDSDELSQTGKLQFKLEKITDYKETKVRVVIWNTKYDNVNHSDSQTITIHWNLQACPISTAAVPPPSSVGTPSSTLSSSTTAMPTTSSDGLNDGADIYDGPMIGLITGVAVLSALVLVLIAVILLLLMKMYARGNQPRPNLSTLELSQRMQPSDEKISVHSDSAESEPISYKLLEVLDMITDCTRKKINCGIKPNSLILKCVRDLIESICDIDINIDEQTAGILSKAHQILNERSIQQRGTCQQQPSITPNGNVADNEENVTQRDVENKGNVQMDGEKKGNTIQLDGDCHQNKCIREKDISDSKLIVNEQELLSEILQSIEKKLEQFRQKDGDL